MNNGEQSPITHHSIITDSKLTLRLCLHFYPLGSHGQGSNHLA